MSSNSPNPARSTFDQIAAIDQQLCQLLKWLDEHQQKQQRIRLLKQRLEQADSTWRNGMKRFKRALDDIEHVKESNKRDLESIERTYEAKMDPETVLTYAKLLAPFTSAPPNSLVRDGKLVAAQMDSHSLPLGAIPPFPTDQAMRQGRLQFKQAPLEDGIGETTTAAPPAQAVQDVKQQDKDKIEASERLEAHRKAQEQEWELDLDLNPDL